MTPFIYSLPSAVLIVLIFILLFSTFYCRFKLVRTRQITIAQLVNKDFSNASHYVTLLGYSYDNQFQQPVLFMLLNALVLMFGLESYASLILSWMFVAARYWHSYEHVINKSILRRTIAFGLGSITHLMIWGLFFNELAQF
ncbi:MAPEG family protein [Pseudoalteromonas sp. CF6-2]|uniref:MAPEG family protein n=1 Tax=Pseudoalteromonas TaxID=53246 RepID=UPI000781896C|nr:MAPEG family protein [Pseudoalteromonas arabiensis]UJX26984.1 MAPEG family protein [Pseudoalteromonas sp. CF6-2]